MIKQVKSWLGIEGVKLQLELPESVKMNAKTLKGKVILSSQTDQEVSLIEIELVEKYERGRGKDKKIDVHSLGAIKHEGTIKVPANQPISLDFSLPFEPLSSEMDQYARKNFLFRGLVKTAKWVSSVKSVYYVYAKAKVQGVALDPFAEQPIKMIN